MKSIFKWMFAAIFICGLTVSSCKKDPQPTPDPEPQTVTRLARQDVIRSNAVHTAVSSVDFTWENGKLMQVCDSVSLFSVTTTNLETLIYEDGNVVRIEEQNGRWVHHFTYENDLIVSFLTLHDSDSSTWGTVSYYPDGYVKEIMYHDRVKTTHWSLTWVDGDATEIVEHILEPEDVAGTYVYNYTYDDKPCVFNGVPWAYAIFDGDGVRAAIRKSKHNVILEGSTQTYDDKGLLISTVRENESVYYRYIEQTVE